MFPFSFYVFSFDPVYKIGKTISLLIPSGQSPNLSKDKQNARNRKGVGRFVATVRQYSGKTTLFMIASK
jgi:hypothetical protein